MSEAMCAGCGRWPVFYETTQSCSTCQPGRASEMIDGLRARAEAAERERDRLRGAAAYHMRERKALAEQRDAALAELERRLDPGEYEAIYRQIATPRASILDELPTDPGREGPCAACPHSGSEHLHFSGLCTECDCVEHEAIEVQP